MRKIFIILLLGVFLITSVSAAEWDNDISNYDEQTEVITFKNGCVFGVCVGDVIGQAQLKTPKDFHVAQGYNYVWEIDAWVYEDYNDFLKQFEYLDMKTKNKINRDLDIKILSYEAVEVNDYETQFIGYNANGTEEYESVIVGSHIEQQEVWTKVTPADLKKNERVTLRGYTDVQIGDYIDWSPMIFGVRVSHDIWATWENDLKTNLVSYYNFNETSGDVVDIHGTNNGTNSGATRGVTGKIENAFSFISNDYITQQSNPTIGTTYSFSMWVNSSVFSGGLQPIYSNRLGTGSAHIYLGTQSGEVFMYDYTGTPSTSVTSTITLNDNDWHHIVVVLTPGFADIYIDGVHDGQQAFTRTASTKTTYIGRDVPNTQYWNGLIDEFGLWDRALNLTEIEFLYNNGTGLTYDDDNAGITVTLNAPENDSISNDATVDFDWTITPVVSNITNWTLNVWYENNTLAHQHINTTINTDETTTIIHNDTLFLDESYRWNVESCANNDECDLSNNWTFTLDTAPPVVNITYPPEGFIVTTPLQNITLNYTVEHPVGNLSNCFYNTSSNSTPTNISCVTNTSSFLYPVTNPNNLTVYVYANDTAGNLGSDNVTMFKDDVAPSINIEAPDGIISFGAVGDAETLNVTITDTNIDTCWYDYNGTNVTIDGCISGVKNSTQFILQTNNMNLTVYSNDSLGNENSSFTSWEYLFFEGNESFNSDVTETSRQDFEITITTISNILSIDSFLYYNGTLYTADTNCVSNFCDVSTAIDIPLIESGEQENRTFFWQISGFTENESFSFNSTGNNQTTNRLHLEKCNATYTEQSLNFTSFDEATESPVDPFKFDAALNFWTGTGTVKRNNTISESSVSSLQLCILPTADILQLDATIEYDEATGSNYTTRNYFFQNDTINNVSQDIRLGLLLAEDSTSFILKVQDTDILPVANVLIFTQRFYPGDGIFKTVQVSETDDSGSTVGFFKTETVDYRFILKQGGETVLITNKQKIVGQEVPFTLTFTIGEDVGSAWEEYEDLADLESSLLFNKTSDVVSFSYADTSGNFTSSRLIVSKVLYNSSSNLDICDVTSTQSSAVLSCNLTGNSTGTYIARSLITRDGTTSLIEQIQFQREDFTSASGRLGLLLGFFVILISAFMFKYNEIAGIIMVNLAIIATNMMGLIAWGYGFISASIAVSIITLVLLER